MTVALYAVARRALGTAQLSWEGGTFTASLMPTGYVADLELDSDMALLPVPVTQATIFNRSVDAYGWWLHDSITFSALVVTEPWTQVVFWREAGRLPCVLATFTPLPVDSTPKPFSILIGSRYPGLLRP
jgi:hypothetical protein